MIGLSRVFSAAAPVVIGFVAAYLLEPPVARCQRGVERLTKRSFGSRWPGAACAYGLLLGVAAAAVALLAAKLGNVDIPARVTATRAAFGEWYAQTALHLYAFGLADAFGEAMNRAVYAIADWLASLTGNLPRLFAKAADMAADWALGLIIAFYFSKDKDKLIPAISGAAKRLTPPRFLSPVTRFLTAAHGVFAGYLRGQLTDAAIMAALFSAALWLIKIPFAVPIGLFGGVANLVPYFGAAVAMAAAVVSGLSSGEPIKALYAAIAMAALQQLDSVVLIPRVVGKRVDVSPLGVLVCITIGGGLFGLWGMALAVPVYAVAKQLSTGAERRR